MSLPEKQADASSTIEPVDFDTKEDRKLLWKVDVRYGVYPFFWTARNSILPA